MMRLIESENVVGRVLEAFSPRSQVAGIRPWAGMGFSGARIWKVQLGTDYFCLRCWGTTRLTREQLLWQHRVLLNARVCSFVPIPVRTLQGETLVSEAGTEWEMTPWMPGVADFNERPSLDRLRSALAAVQEFHQATGGGARVTGHSETAAQRALQIERLAQRWPELSARLKSSVNSEDYELIVKANHHVEHLLPQARSFVLADGGRPHQLQPVIRDLWHDHLLFTDEKLTGLVDYGAMQMDRVECDWARCLGSLRMQGFIPWQDARDVMNALPGLPHLDWALINWLHLTGTILGWLNWCQWLFLEGQQFAQSEKARARMEALVCQLEWCHAAVDPLGT